MICQVRNRVYSPVCYCWRRVWRSTVGKRCNRAEARSWFCSCKLFSRSRRSCQSSPVPRRKLKTIVKSACRVVSSPCRQCGRWLKPARTWRCRPSRPHADLGGPHTAPPADDCVEDVADEPATETEASSLQPFVHCNRRSMTKNAVL